MIRHAEYGELTRSGTTGACPGSNALDLPTGHELLIPVLRREAETPIRGKTADQPPQKKSVENAEKVIPAGKR